MAQRAQQSRVLGLDDFERLGMMDWQRTVCLLDSSSAEVGEPGSADFFIPRVGEVEMI